MFVTVHECLIPTACFWSFPHTVVCLYFNHSKKIRLRYTKHLIKQLHPDQVSSEEAAAGAALLFTINGPTVVYLPLGEKQKVSNRLTPEYLYCLQDEYRLHARIHINKGES